MIDDRDQEDPGLARMLRAVQADADPALWTRVRARIEARSRVPSLLLWAMRPAALAASLGLLVATAGLAIVLANGTAGEAGDDVTSLADALVAERDDQVSAPGSSSPPAGSAVPDTGSGR